MAERGDANATEANDVLEDILTSPPGSVKDLPVLLGALDDEDRQLRLVGTFGLCLLAASDPESIPSIVRRLADRFDGSSRAEAKLAYDYIASQFPERVDETHQERRDETTGGGPTGSGDGSTRHEDVGRVRPPGGMFGPRSVEPDRDVIDPTDPQRHPDADQPLEPEHNPEDVDEPRASTGVRSEQARERRQWNRLFGRLTTIVEQSRFDDLMVLSGRKHSRYAEIARVLAEDSGVERAMAIRLFHRPTGESDSFAPDLGEALDQWAEIGDHSGIVRLFHWGSQPRPWAGTDPSDATLADRSGPIEPAAALSLTIELADALEYAHQHGVVHGGIDPENVAFPTEAGATPQTASLDNPGLLGVYRWHVTPATLLDPRYAAPEYYDRRFGRIHHGTDIYQLGAVLYRFLTGRPPVSGEFEQIRQQVIDGEPPAPSRSVDVPGAIDDIVGKAMAKRSLVRYETINDFRRDVVAVHEELTHAE
ncbi:serine/threonine protein kinase [Halorhabdus sp. CBA1104]|uniref:protein kinase domain-containing protein n=1 Tax=Halorhabdus sp. CBA1104 TaxID=1380432 RepID=UPI0012B37271|nr:serine/threonine protein kinase [Halorhabdus sp. CBA1104]QGN06558.1 serine/threonine protein kinase [Halorhabdus sp. CBA1104]